MPPVNTSASSPDVDNEATAELPVLDVAAYESTMGERTDSWAAPSCASTPMIGNSTDATIEMPAPKAESIPTLHEIVPAYDLDHSGTHEMPAMPESKQAAHSKGRRKAAPEKRAAAERSAPDTAGHVAAPITLPPSPPLIEEWRNALARA